MDEQELNDLDLKIEQVACQNCGFPFDNFIEDFAHGDSVCPNCACVARDRLIDLTAEKRSFRDATGTSGNDPSRTSKVDDNSPGSLSTSISAGRGAKGGVGIAVLHNRVTKAAGQQKLSDGYSLIEQYSSTLNVSQNVVAIARETFASFERKRTKTMRLKLDSLIGAIMHIACKKAGATRTFKDISGHIGVPSKHITEAYKNVKNILPNEKKNTSSVADLVPQICTDLGLPHKVRMLAQEVTIQAQKHLEGKNPSTIAAVSIWLTAKEAGMEKSVKVVAEAAHISHTTVRNVSKELINNQSSIINDKMGQELRKLAATANNTASSGQ
eukprot:TRINITY_DN2639_c0_g1_i2.p1 TRINITY_DN2639_c0_g1~~TRINITY_DN2639_c0_g1_i2.p1  ORF type:complete len:327 (+),score=74.18 TRINITY_DN2639_c0_g1_i2:22-1002(+)